MNAVFTLITTNFLLFTFLNHNSRRRKGKIGFGRIMHSVKSPRNHSLRFDNINRLLNGTTNVLKDLPRKISFHECLIKCI